MDNTSLFPILAPKLTGIARLAAEAEHADEGHLIEFRTMKVRSLMNKSVSKRQLSLAYSINPYRGCEFGCRYCYARYTHEFMAPKVGTPLDGIEEMEELRGPEAFERRIFIKQNAAWLLEQELRKIDPAEEIAIGTATDPYQPIERRARVTRSILEVLARREGYRIGIVTKSRLIERDIDLLQMIASKNQLVVHETITTPDIALARLLEPRAPRPDLRFAAVKKMRAAGITAGIFGSPVLPGITDTANALEHLARQAAAVGASFFTAQPLFLKPCSRPTYLSFVREHFPSLMQEYETRFATRDFATAEYRRELGAMVAAACAKHGLLQRSTDPLLSRDGQIGRRLPLDARPPAQQRLFG